MFGVLVVILCPDRVADLGFGTGERQTPFIVSLRVLGALRLGASGTLVHRFERAANDAAGLGARALMIVFGPFCIAHFLVVAGKCFVRNDHNFCRLIGSVVVAEPAVLHTK